MQKNLCLIFLVFLSLQSCVIGQDKVESEKSKSKQNTGIIKENLLKDGYELGIVKIPEESDCTYIILNETTKVNLDPINFNISDYEDFRVKDLKIYFKYRQLRMMNRCNEALPIELISILKRED